MMDDVRTADGAENAREDPHPVRSLLEELDVQGSVTSLDMRVVDVEQRLRKIAERVDMSNRRQLGELEVMRARIKDIVTLIRDGASDREDTFVQLDGELATLLDERIATLVEQLAELREDVGTQTATALARIDDALDEMRAETTGAVAAATSEAVTIGTRLDELAGAVAEASNLAAAEITEEADARRGELEALEKRVSGRLDVAAEAASDARRRLDERIEALRRELDATSGELRAHVAVALGDITSRMDQLGERVGEGPAVGDAEDWQQLARDLASRDDDIERRLRNAIRDEAATRMSAVADVAEQAAEALRLARESLDVDATAQVRSATDTDKVMASVQALGTRLNVLQSTMAHAINDVASGLGNKISMLVEQLDSTRTAVGRTQQRLAGLDRIDARLDALEAAGRDRTHEQALAQQVTDTQRELSRIAGRLDSFARQAAAADERAEALRREVGVLGDELATAGGWRSELRDLTARTSELAARVAEAETIARRAGNAVVEAVRQARGEAAPLEQGLD